MIPDLQRKSFCAYAGKLGERGSRDMNEDMKCDSNGFSVNTYQLVTFQ